jgi:hypothetical protein
VNVTGWGLVADLVGVILVAIALPGFARVPEGTHVGESWVSVRWGGRVAATVGTSGWVLVVAGLAFQLVGSLADAEGSIVVLDGADAPAIINALSTTFLVGLTYVYVRQNRETLKHLEESKQPSVIVDIAMIDHRLVLEVANVGDRPARDVRLIVKDNVPWTSTDLKRVALLDEGMPYLAPGRRLQLSCGFVAWEKTEAERPTMDVAVTFSDESGRRRESRAHFDLRSYRGVLTSSFGDPVDAVAHELERMRMDRMSERSSGFSIVGRSWCTFCRELISAQATKCPHCLEFLPEGWSTPAKAEPQASSAAEELEG